jgi:hypothetical protein
MTDPIDLNSKNYQRLVTLPEPQLITLPPQGDYVGSMKASDRETLAGPLGTPKESYPGSGMPGKPWKTISPAPVKRGALRR